MTPELKEQIAKIEPMHGWCTIQKAEALTETVLEIKPDIIVEIGVFGGRSLAAFGFGVMANNKGYAFGIDPWTKNAALEGEVGEGNAEWWNKLDIDDIHAHCMHWLTHLGVWRRVRILAVGSETCHEAFNQIDILHIDGNHSELASCRDVRLYVPKVRPGGYVWFDDTGWTTTKKAIIALEALCEPVREVGDCRLYRKKHDQSPKVDPEQERATELLITGSQAARDGNEAAAGSSPA